MPQSGGGPSKSRAEPRLSAEKEHILPDVRRNRNTLRLTYAIEILTMLVLIGLLVGIASWGILEVLGREFGSDRVQILQMLSFSGGNGLLGFAALKMPARLGALNAGFVQNERRYTSAVAQIRMCETLDELRAFVELYKCDQPTTRKPKRV